MGVSYALLLWLIDNGGITINASEFVPTALSTLSLFLAGYLVYLVQRRHDSGSDWKRQIETALQRGRDRDEALGYDIQATRNAISWLCGKTGHDQPRYDRSSDI